MHSLQPCRTLGVNLLFQVSGETTNDAGGAPSKMKSGSETEQARSVTIDGKVKVSLFAVFKAQSNLTVAVLMARSFVITGVAVVEAGLSPI